LRVDRYRDMDELINFWARSGLLSPISYMPCNAEFYGEKIPARSFSEPRF